MGKGEQDDHNLRQQIHNHRDGAASSGLFCERCSRISRYFSFRCFFVLLLCLALLVSGIFWILPSYPKTSGFDAKDEIKLSATVQACFRLQKPVLQLVPYIGRLEYDIYGEISTPDTKVVVLSMHQSDTSNWTDVVFGVLSDPINVPINSVFLSVLRSSLIELFLQQSNLTLTTSIFGEPFMFEILKFPGGITIIPPQSNFIWQSALTLFNFTLNNYVSEVVENLNELKDQLIRGLHLRPYENLFVQLTNDVGSTLSTPITVQAFVMSVNGIILPQRLKQLAQTITDSPADNLGLDNSVFGNVNSVTLSSFLNGITHVPTTASSPAPTPELSYTGEPSTISNPAPPSYSPVSPSGIHHPPPCFNLRYSSTAYMTDPCLPCPSQSLPPLSSPSPSLAYQYLASPSSSAVVPTYREIWLLGIYGFLIFHLICWLQ